MLLPALSRARKSARQAQCINNLKQIQTATVTYAGDWEDYIPPVNNQDGTNNNIWADRILLYLTDINSLKYAWQKNKINFHVDWGSNPETDHVRLKFYLCPEAPLEFNGDHTKFSFRLNYGINDKVAIGIKFHQLRNNFPKHLTPFLYSDNNGNSPNSYKINYYSKGMSPGSRHQLSNMVGMPDGSVKAVKTIPYTGGASYTERTLPRIYWNEGTGGL